MKFARREFLKAMGAAAALGGNGKSHATAGPQAAQSAKQPEKAMSTAKMYDVAVIGAGVFGAWTAYLLRKSGATVLLVDEYGPSNARASSGGESRIIRMGYGPSEIYTRWSMKALPLWQQLFAEAGQPQLFQRTGVLWMAKAEDAYMHETLEMLGRAGAKFEKLSPEEVRVRYRQIVFDEGTWGILEPDSGVLLARRAVQAVVEQARKNGVEYRTEAVFGPMGEGRLTVVGTRSGETINAGAFVFACGPWLPKVFPQILGDRIFPSRQEVFFFGVPGGETRFTQPAMPTWICLSDEYYGMPDIESRGFKIAFDRHGEKVDPDTQSRIASAEGAEAARAYLARRFPVLKDAPVVETRVCQYENTSNGDFLVDKHPQFENVWVVGGGSGHGFKHGPSMGEYAAGCVRSGKITEKRFSLETKEAMQKRAVY